MNNARPKRTQHRASYGLLLVALVSLCGLAIPSPECSGVDRTWQQNAGGSWVEPSHWIGGVVPGVGDRAILPQDSFNTYEVLYDGEYTANTALSSLLISGFFNIGVSRPTTLRQDQANTDMYANFEYVGYEGRGLATYTQSASTNSVDLLYIGWGSTASGAYNLSGSGLLSVNEYAYVLPGGIFNQTGGTFAGILEVQGGIYNLSGTGGFGT